VSDEDLVEAARGAIVVGVDGSEGARTALAYALEEGARRELPVVAVSVFSSPSPWAPQVSTVLDEDRLVGEVQRAAHRLVDEVVAEQRARGVEAPRVRVAIRTGVPADVLVKVSREAALLVVGYPTRGPHVSRLIGSVGLGVAAHAECPVTLVPSRPGAG
jgi:nucleotide-binding universal stress UspA family protein